MCGGCGQSMPYVATPLGYFKPNFLHDCMKCSHVYPDGSTVLPWNLNKFVALGNFWA